LRAGPTFHGFAGTGVNGKSPHTGHRRTFQALPTSQRGGSVPAAVATPVIATVVIPTEIVATQAVVAAAARFDPDGRRNGDRELHRRAGAGGLGVTRAGLAARRAGAGRRPPVDTVHLRARPGRGAVAVPGRRRAEVEIRND
jgi:hypothetical protein